MTWFYLEYDNFHVLVVYSATLPDALCDINSTQSFGTTKKQRKILSYILRGRDVALKQLMLKFYNNLIDVNEGASNVS